MALGERIATDLWNDSATRRKTKNYLWESKDKNRANCKSEEMSHTNSLPFKAVNPDLRKYGAVLRGKICIIEGLISAGKSTASAELEKFVTNLGIPCKFFPEPLIPELLALFLSDQKKHAFAFQLTMLVKRQAIYREAFEAAKQGYFCIIDRSIHGDFCFALMHKNRGNITDASPVMKDVTEHRCKMNVKVSSAVWKFCPHCSTSLIAPPSSEGESPSEWKSYLSVLHSEKFEHPDYVLFLQVTPQKAIERCKRRDRDGEKAYDLEYFTELCQVYSSVIPQSPANQVLVLDWNEDRETATIARTLLNEMRKVYELNGAQ